MPIDDPSVAGTISVCWACQRQVMQTLESILPDHGPSPLRGYT